MDNHVEIFWILEGSRTVRMETHQWIHGMCLIVRGRNGFPAQEFNTSMLTARTGIAHIPTNRNEIISGPSALPPSESSDSASGFIPKQTTGAVLGDLHRL